MDALATVTYPGTKKNLVEGKRTKAIASLSKYECIAVY